jgi:hypothetical protein
VLLSEAEEERLKVAVTETERLMHEHDCRILEEEEAEAIEKFQLVLEQCETAGEGNNLAFAKAEAVDLTYMKMGIAYRKVGRALKDIERNYNVVKATIPSMLDPVTENVNQRREEAERRLLAIIQAKAPQIEDARRDAKELRLSKLQKKMDTVLPVQLVVRTRKHNEMKATYEQRLIEMHNELTDKSARQRVLLSEAEEARLKVALTETERLMHEHDCRILEASEEEAMEEFQLALEQCEMVGKGDAEARAGTAWVVDRAYMKMGIAYRKVNWTLDDIARNYNVVQAKIPSMIDLGWKNAAERVEEANQRLLAIIQAKAPQIEGARRNAKELRISQLERKMETVLPAQLVVRTRKHNERKATVELLQNMGKATYLPVLEQRLIEMHNELTDKELWREEEYDRREEMKAQRRTLNWAVLNRWDMITDFTLDHFLQEGMMGDALKLNMEKRQQTVNDWLQQPSPVIQQALSTMPPIERLMIESKRALRQGQEKEPVSSTSSSSSSSSPLSSPPQLPPPQRQPSPLPTIDIDIDIDNDVCVEGLKHMTEMVVEEAGRVVYGALRWLDRGLDEVIADARMVSRFLFFNVRPEKDKLVTLVETLVKSARELEAEAEGYGHRDTKTEVAMVWFRVKALRESVRVFFSIEPVSYKDICNHCLRNDHHCECRKHRSQGKRIQSELTPSASLLVTRDGRYRVKEIDDYD